MKALSVTLPGRFMLWVMMDGIVTASHQPTVDDALYGPTRLRRANEGAMRANIAAFLEKLQLLDLTRLVVYR